MGRHTKNCGCTEAQALRAELAVMKAEHAYLVGMAAPEDLRVMRQELAKEHEAPPAVRCDHKFIDSTRCLKCGFDPAGGR